MGYTQDMIKAIYLNNGWILDDIYCNTAVPMHCFDNDGYQYQKTLGDVLRGKSSKRFHSKNPYTIENIDLFFKLNNIPLKRLSDNYIDSKTSMKWECSCGESFEALFNQIQQGKWFCNKCSRSKRWDGFRDYVYETQQECEKRGYILLSSNIKRSTDTFEYLCREHINKGAQTSSYNQMIKNHCGCKWCGIQSRIEQHKIPEYILKELTESKGFIYDGCDYDNEGGKSNKVNIHILCPNHIDKGVQRVKYDNLKRNVAGCKYCIGRERTQNELQQELNAMHGTIDILFYNSYMKDIIVKCRTCGHVWTTKGPSLISGHRCPNCKKSNFELETSNVLNYYGYHYVSQKCFDNCKDIHPLPFDFYLINHNILIETDGEGHYKPIPRGNMTEKDAEIQLQKIQSHDAIKTQYCIDNNIPLIRVPYWERNNIENFLIKEIDKLMN